MRDTLDVDVNDDTNAPSKAAALQKLIDAGTAEQASLATLHLTDEGVVAKADAYSKSLAALLDAARALKALFDDVAKLSERLVGLATAHAEVTAATNAFNDAANSDDLLKAASALESSADGDEVATRLEKLTLSSSGRAAAQRLARAARAEAQARRDSADVQTKLAALVPESKTKRADFASARTDFRNADDALGKYCSAK